LRLPRGCGPCLLLLAVAGCDQDFVPYLIADVPPPASDRLHLSLEMMDGKGPSLPRDPGPVIGDLARGQITLVLSGKMGAAWSVNGRRYTIEERSRSHYRGMTRDGTRVEDRLPIVKVQIPLPAPLRDKRRAVPQDRTIELSLSYEAKDEQPSWRVKLVPSHFSFYSGVPLQRRRDRAYASQFSWSVGINPTLDRGEALVAVRTPEHGVMRTLWGVRLYAARHYSSTYLFHVPFAVLAERVRISDKGLGVRVQGTIEDDAGRSAPFDRQLPLAASEVSSFFELMRQSTRLSRPAPSTSRALVVWGRGERARHYLLPPSAEGVAAREVDLLVFAEDRPARRKLFCAVSRERKGAWVHARGRHVTVYDSELTAHRAGTGVRRKLFTWAGDCERGFSIEQGAPDRWQSWVRSVRSMD